MSRLASQNKADPAKTFLRMDTAEQLLTKAKQDADKTPFDIDDGKDKLIELYRKQLEQEIRDKILNEMIEVDKVKTDEKLKESYYNKEKIIFLFNRKPRNKEIREIEKHFRLLRFDSKRGGHLGKKIKDIQYEALTIPFGTKRGRLFYSTIRSDVIEDENTHVIFITNNKVPHEEIRKITGCDYIKKKLPKHTDSSAVYKILLFSDHVAKIATSCLPIFKKIVK